MTIAGLLIGAMVLYRDDPFLEQHSLLGLAALVFVAGGLFTLVDRTSNIWLPTIYGALAAVTFLTPFLASANNTLLVTMQALIAGMTFVAASALTGAFAASVIRQRAVSRAQHNPANLVSSLSVTERKLLRGLTALTAGVSMFWNVIAKLLAAGKP